jgi:23S rRNA pseudouridine1911/1915/1917 synthase
LQNAKSGGTKTTVNHLQLDVLYQDNHLLAANKPAGLPTMGAAAGRASLVLLARRYIQKRYDKPGNVYVGVVHRLDAPATGVVLLARTSKAAKRLQRQFAGGEPVKTYWSIVEHEPDPPTAECVDWLRHDDARRRVVVATPHMPGARQARLRYRTLQRGPQGTLLEIELETGRKHQIRVQLAHRGWPIVGDARYGAETPFASGIALHARRLEITHPVRRTSLVIEAPLPPGWKNFVRIPGT